MTTFANDVVVDAYRKFLNRSPEPEGFTYWVGVVTKLEEEGKTKLDIQNFLTEEFTKSEEYKKLRNL